MHLRALAAALGLFFAAPALAPIHLYGQNLPATLSVEQKEAFLKDKKTKVQERKSVSKGVTGTVRVTLSNGALTHDASVQTIDEFKQIFQPSGGKAETNFKDTYKFNIAAYMLAKQLGLEDMVPVSVERNYAVARAAFTWWIDDVLMEEGERITKRVQAPDEAAWTREMALVRVFDQLIANADRNSGNLIIDKSWHVWMIDHTRAFRVRKDLPNAAGLTLIDRGLLVKLRSLQEAPLRKELGRWLTKQEIQAMLARRDLIVASFEARGETVLFDRPAR